MSVLPFPFFVFKTEVKAGAKSRTFQTGEFDSE